MAEYGRIHTDGSRSGGQPVLKPCPFCGGRAEIAEIETEDLPLWLGECQEPPCEAVAPVRPTRDEAIAAWNTRQPTQSDALREALGSVIALLDTQAEPPKSVVSVQDYARWANARIGLGLVMIAPRLRAALQEQSK